MEMEGNRDEILGDVLWDFKDECGEKALFNIVVVILNFFALTSGRSGDIRIWTVFLPNLFIVQQNAVRLFVLSC
jgi:hypothetical protein